MLTELLKRCWAQMPTLAATSPASSSTSVAAPAVAAATGGTAQLKPNPPPTPQKKTNRRPRRDVITPFQLIGGDTERLPVGPVMSIGSAQYVVEDRPSPGKRRRRPSGSSSTTSSVDGTGTTKSVKPPLSDSVVDSTGQSARKRTPSPPKEVKPAARKKKKQLPKPNKATADASIPSTAAENKGSNRTASDLEDAELIRSFGERASRKLCLKNLPPKTKADDLIALIPELTGIRIVQKPKGRHCSAFVDFASEEIAEKYFDVLTKQDKLKGRTFVVDYCGVKSKTNSKKFTPGAHEADHRKLFVDGLKNDTTVDIIHSFFPTAIKVSKRRRKGRTAFAFVTFANQDTACAAFQSSQNAVIDNQHVNVQYAIKPKLQPPMVETAHVPVKAATKRARHRAARKQKAESGLAKPKPVTKDIDDGVVEMPHTGCSGLDEDEPVEMASDSTDLITEPRVSLLDPASVERSSGSVLPASDTAAAITGPASPPAEIMTNAGAVSEAQPESRWPNLKFELLKPEDYPGDLRDLPVLQGDIDEVLAWRRRSADAPAQRLQRPDSSSFPLNFLTGA